MGVVEKYIAQVKSNKKRFRMAAAILVVLSLLVVVEVSWSLRSVGITIANNATCGREEHQHDEACVKDKQLICDEQIEDELNAEHEHNDDCYQYIYQCEREEHIHDFSCYADDTADLETKEIWEASLPELSGDWAQDLIVIAQSQIGNGESERNFIIAEDQETRNGITRYGQWYGNPYGDWNAMFMMFCIHYAELPEEVIPMSPGVSNMVIFAQDQDIFNQPNDDMYQKGNIIFLDNDQNEAADQVVIMEAKEDDKLFVIGGDIDNEVKAITIQESEANIVGYLDIKQLQEGWNAQLESEKASVTLDIEFNEDKTFSLIAQLVNAEAEMYTWQWQYSKDGQDNWIDIEGANELVYTLADTEENAERFYRLQGHKVKTRVRTYALREEADETDDSVLTSEAISPFSIQKNNNNYTIDVYAYPVDENNQRIMDISVKSLGQFTVNTTNQNISVQSKFDESLGEYQSAFFGSLTEVSADNIKEVWRRYSLGTYYLAYRKTDNSENRSWLRNSNSTISLYLRYRPQFTVTFESEGHESLTQSVYYQGYPTLTEPADWQREHYSLLGFVKNGQEENIYSYQDILKMPINEATTYTAKWRQNVIIHFDLLEYEDQLLPLKDVVIGYGDSVSLLPTPAWINQSDALAFDGWYKDKELSEKVTKEDVFYEDITLYPKWQPKEDGYFIYFMDFARDGKTPLVIMTYGVTQGQCASPYIPENAPQGKQWDGKWYLDDKLINEYYFAIPVSDMSEYLTGANQRDLYVYPGTKDVCRAIFVTYGTRIDPITVVSGESINLDLYIPERVGHQFVGWTLEDGTSVSGLQKLTQTTTYYAQWNPDYVPFEAILRIENENDTNMTQAEILGTWYAKAGSKIRVNSTYSGSGDSRSGTHEVVCVLDGKEYPVYMDASLKQEATLSDVYEKYFIYNNTGTNWTDEVNWDDVYISGEVPYSTRLISSSGDTIINFDYMRVRNDIVFTIPNCNSKEKKGGYMDVYKLYRDGVITGSVAYTQTAPTSTGQNVSASGVTAQNIRWSYNAAATVSDSSNNYYILHDMKYGERIFEVYPVGGIWLTPWDSNSPYHQYAVESGAYFSSRRQDLTADFFSGSGRGVKPYSLITEFRSQEYIALMYVLECLEGETADFTYNGVGYKVDTELCEVVKHTGHFGIKALDGMTAGKSVISTYGNYNKYYTANTIQNDEKNYAVNMNTAKIGNVSVYSLFAEKYWSYYASFSGVASVKTFDKAYIFYYDRLKMNIQFDFGYDANDDHKNEVVTYSDILYGERIDEYQFGSPDFNKHEYLNREGYEFAGWLDASGFVLEEEDWDSLIASGDSVNNTLIFIAKWKKVSNNIVEYYDDRLAEEPFETHYFDDGELVEYPTMKVYPQGWAWQIYGEGAYEAFNWDVPMYGEYGVQETREINGEEVVVNVIRIYGTWDNTHTKVIYDPNAPHGGIVGTAPSDTNEYTIYQSEVPVASRGNTANTDSKMVFVGWQLDKNGIVYQPGNHVPVHWPRTMIFTAQWAKPEDVVYLRYDPNGGTPADIYPNESGFEYQKNATALVWNNEKTNNDAWFVRYGYTFAGWNTKADGTGTSYPIDSKIVLTEPVTTLYAQWIKHTYTFSLYKKDSERNVALEGAKFGLYKKEDNMYLLVDTQVTNEEGYINFQALEIDTLYKLVEEKAPNGYAIIHKEIYFEVVPSTNNLSSLVFYDANRNIISMPDGIEGNYVTINKLLTLTIKNLRGYELPSTGGIAIYFLILLGLCLILVPIVYVLYLRHKYYQLS